MTQLVPQLANMASCEW